MKDPAKTIIQLIPATGWYAVYQDGDDRLVEPLAAWALVEQDGDRTMVGIDPTGEGWDGSTVEEIDNFVEYIHKD